MQFREHNRKIHTNIPQADLELMLLDSSLGNELIVVHKIFYSTLCGILQKARELGYRPTRARQKGSSENNLLINLHARRKTAHLPRARIIPYETKGMVFYAIQYPTLEPIEEQFSPINTH